MSILKKRLTNILKVKKKQENDSHTETHSLGLVHRPVIAFPYFSFNSFQCVVVRCTPQHKMT